MRFNICPLCGAHLDAGERCDCKEVSEQNKRKYESLLTDSSSGQLSLNEPALRKEGTTCFSY